MDNAVHELIDYFMGQCFTPEKYIITLNINQPLPFTMHELLEWIKSRLFLRTVISFIIEDEEIFQVHENTNVEISPYHKYFYNATLENYRQNMINNMQTIDKLDNRLFGRILRKKLPLFLEHSGVIVLFEIAEYITDLPGKEGDDKTSDWVERIRQQINNYGQLYTYIIRMHRIKLNICNNIAVMKLKLELILNDDYYRTIGELKSQLHFAQTNNNEEELDKIIQKLGLKLETYYDYKSHYLTEYISDMQYSDFV